MGKQLTPDEVAELEAKKQAEKQKSLNLRDAHKAEEKKNTSGNKSTEV